MKQPFQIFLQKHPWSIALMLFGAVLFLMMLFSVLFNGSFLKLDFWLSSHIPVLHSPALTKAVRFVTDLNGVVGSAILSFFIVLFLAYKKYYEELKFYLLSFLGASALFTVIKLLVERVRPALKIINEQGWSFPSGHSTMAMTIALALYFIAVSKVHSTLGHAVLLACVIVWPLLIVSTRLYLNVHWLSDTIAGLSLGVFWVTFVWLLTQRHKSV